MFSENSIEHTLAQKVVNKYKMKKAGNSNKDRYSLLIVTYLPLLG